MHAALARLWATPLAVRLVLALGVELAYLLATRPWPSNWMDDVGWELQLTALRGLVALIHLALFWPLLRFRAATPARLLHPLILLALGLFLLQPVLLSDWGHQDDSTRWIFAATSLTVGLREELFYRGILQTVFAGAIGFWPALLLSSLLFVGYHYGAGALSLLHVFEILASSLFLGLLYQVGGSLWAPVALHAGYDAIVVFSPYLTTPWSPEWRYLFGAAAVVLAVAWAWRFKAVPAWR